MYLNAFEDGKKFVKNCLTRSFGIFHGLSLSPVLSYIAAHTEESIRFLLKESPIKSGSVLESI